MPSRWADCPAVTAALILAVVLVAANALFVLTEFAITRIRPTQVQDLVDQGRPGAKSLKHAVEHIDSYLAACQLGITLASLGLGAVGEPAFHDLLKPALGEAAVIGSVGLATLVAFSTITVLHVVLGELAPKSVSLSRTVPAALFSAPLMRVFYLLTKPFVDLFNGMGNLVLKPFGIPPAREAGHAAHSLEELRMVVRESGEGGEMDAGEVQLAEAAFDFGGRRVRDVMRPRVDVQLVGEDEGFEVAARRVLETGLTRLPLVEAHRGLDVPLGVVHAKDLLGAALQEPRPPLRDIARPIIRLPDSMLADHALRELRGGRTHIAIVDDEHGTAVGIVTIEDIVEELVGEIEDEFDEHVEPQVLREDECRVLVDGAMTLADLGEAEPSLRIEDPHEATVGGLVLEHAGRVPDPGDVVVLPQFDAEVLEVEGTRVMKVRLLERGTAAEGEAATGA
jgi:CBS domain containing-hemolysin-like protein